MATLWKDLAEYVGPTPNMGGKMSEYRGQVTHIMAGSYAGSIAWGKNPSSSVSFHFAVRKDGHIAQLVPTDRVAWTQRQGNGHWISVENEGVLPQALTAAQVEANAQLFARGHKEFGWPLAIAASPSGRGLGHHSMGAENGVDWGHSACPGPAIIAQKSAIVSRALAIANGDMDDMDAAQAKQLADVNWSVGRGAPKTDGTGMQAVTYWAAEVNATLALIAAKVDLDPAELAAVAAAAREGAEQGAASSADEIAAAVVALLPEGTLTQADVEAAVRGVFADAATP